MLSMNSFNDSNLDKLIELNLEQAPSPSEHSHSIASVVSEEEYFDD